MELVATIVTGLFLAVGWFVTALIAAPPVLLVIALVQAGARRLKNMPPEEKGVRDSRAMAVRGPLHG